MSFSTLASHGVNGSSIINSSGVASFTPGISNSSPASTTRPLTHQLSEEFQQVLALTVGISALTAAGTESAFTARNINNINNTTSISSLSQASESLTNTAGVPRFDETLGFQQDDADEYDDKSYNSQEVDEEEEDVDDRFGDIDDEQYGNEDECGGDDGIEDDDEDDEEDDGDEDQDDDEDYDDRGNQNEHNNRDDQEDDDDDDDNNLSDLSEIVDERQLIRVSTAPPRPLTDLEEFKSSYKFLLLEQAIVTSQKLIQKDYQKYDLDSQDGQKVFKKFLSIIERLIKEFNCVTACRDYREKFSKAYKILYRNGELCYLTEILDSAQEGFPYLYVNGEKYTFSQEVLEQGQNLQRHFFKLQHIMRNAYTRTFSENLTVSSNSIKREIVVSLENFDSAWARFEMLYVTELMGIEKEARWFVQNAIDIEKELGAIEAREKCRGRVFVTTPEYTQLRRDLCKFIAEMNAVANTEGKGRDDLDFEILASAEALLCRISKEQSVVIRVLAEEIQSTFAALRELFKKYESNIEMVDPQLKNNADLVDALVKYETAWEKGKNYFVDHNKCSYLVHFSHIIETTSKKYPQFAESLECRDADIFLTIPCLLLLKHLDNEDKQICAYFLPQILDEKNRLAHILAELKQEFNQYKALKKSSYMYYNTLERHLLNIEVLTTTETNEVLGYLTVAVKPAASVLHVTASPAAAAAVVATSASNNGNGNATTTTGTFLSKEVVKTCNAGGPAVKKAETVSGTTQMTTSNIPLTVGKIIHKIKQLAMEMQRNNPVEWNSFLDAALYA